MAWYERLFLPDRRGVLKPPVLETDRLLLRPPKLSDAREVYAYACDPAVSRYVLWERHRSVRDARLFLSDLIRENARGEGLTLCCVLKSRDAVVGTIGFCGIDPENMRGEVGYSFAQNVWGHGIATEALQCLLSYGFDVMKLHRIEGECDVRNPASARVMEKCGMIREGVLKARFLNKGEFVDVVLLARTQRE